MMKKTRKKGLDASQVYLTVINRNIELIQENKLLTEEINKLRDSGASLPNNRYHITLKMGLDHVEKNWDFRPVIEMIQFETPELLIRLLREIHHEFACLCIRELVQDLNTNIPRVSRYADCSPHLYILKKIADRIEAIKAIQPTQ